MPISGQGWELYVQRQEVQKSGANTRTYGKYSAFLMGAPISGLNGFVCESIGPGDNSEEDNGKRIEAGTYPLRTQFGRLYRSKGYSEDLVHPGTLKMPGFGLSKTGRRTAILVHPGHPPTLYLSSVGCFNLSKALSSAAEMDYWDSRERVISILQSLKGFSPAAFSESVNTAIPGASIVIDGEPV